MTTTAISTVSTIDSLIGAYRAHVLGRHLPEPVALSFDPYGREICVQTGGGLDPVRKLANLLLWAHTLTGLTATWWHTSSGRLHLSINGRTLGGTRVEVFSGTDFRHCRGLVHLRRGQREGVSLDELAALRELLRDTDPHQEVA